jgi:hypothetical protein
VLAHNRGNQWRRLVLPKEVDQRSQKFDNKIGGTAWIDDVKFEPWHGHQWMIRFPSAYQSGRFKRLLDIT